MLTRKSWVAALRSGKYQQAKTRLRKAEGYCCLGVACDIHDPTLWRTNLTLSSDKETHYHYEFNEGVYGAILPEKLAKALNISRHQENILTDMNDKGNSFEEIADYIEGLPACTS